MDQEDKKKVARGATLYSRKDQTSKDNPKKSDILKRVQKRISNITLPDYQSPIKTIKDEKYQKQVIEYLGKSGIEVTSYKERYIIRRIKVRLGRLRLDSYKQYLSHLQNNPEEIKLVKESLSINVTRFFRNRDTFVLVKDRILPELMNLALKSTRSDINIWSAGCAVGAEPYTVAIIANEAIGEQMRVNITATDVKPELLSMARNGIYSEQYLAEMEKQEIFKYFQKLNEDDYEVSRAIRNMVNFQQHDLMKDSYPGNMDMIICRNVLIYVDRNAQMEIVRKFFDALRPGGVLILGRTETLFGDWRREIDIVSTKHRIYQKKVHLSPLIKIKKKEDGEYKLFSRKKHTRTVTEKAKTLPKKRKIVSNPRLVELKRFRKSSEERKSQWETRNKGIKASTLEHGSQPSRKISTSTDLRSSLRQSQLKVKSPSDLPTSNFQKMAAKRSSDKQKSQSEVKTRKDRGLLSNYRSMLTKANTPVRLVQTRRNIGSQVKLEIDYRDTPEQIYKKLVQKRKIRKARE
ncbi:MAG: Chemotaxis protein methyltransferase [Candidatus Heimdallarchaeota archaeon LC_2]|nr:MAG: Chemotaxis protein methyltransferase [Candidatus Heimdallarchaeota archaeon LC_2]